MHIVGNAENRNGIKDHWASGSSVLGTRFWQRAPNLDSRYGNTRLVTRAEIEIGHYLVLLCHQAKGKGNKPIEKAEQE